MKKSILIFSLLLFFCAPSLKNLSIEEQEQITTHIYSASYNNLFDAILAVLDQSAYVISTADRENGIINTDFLYEAMVLTDGYRRKLNIRIAKISEEKFKVKLNPILEVKITSSLVGRTDYQKLELTKKHASQFQKYFDQIQIELNRQ